MSSLILFTTRCNNLYDSQSIVLLDSFDRINSLEKIHRITECIHNYKTNSNEFLYINSKINNEDTLITNKPLGIYNFINNNIIHDEYRILVDSNMIFRNKIEPNILGAKEGTVVSFGENNKFIGLENSFRDYFLPKYINCTTPSNVHIIHKNNIYKIVDKWLYYYNILVLL